MQSDVDFLFEESDYQFDPIPEIGKALVQVNNRAIQAVLAYKIMGERLCFTYFKVFDHKVNCTNIVKEVFKRVNLDNILECFCEVDEYDLPEQLCLAKCNFVGESKNGYYKFTKEIE